MRFAWRWVGEREAVVVVRVWVRDWRRVWRAVGGGGVEEVKIEGDIVVCGLGVWLEGRGGEG